jgi:glutamate--cysteine ligase
MVPHLTTALTGPINELEQRILESLPAIERWFRLEWMEHTPPFYTSVGLRNAGFKLAPVETSLYPGGFDNLTPEMLPLAVQAAMAAIEKICPEAKNLLLIPQGNTGDASYLMNLQRLVQIFHRAGLNVRLGALDQTITKQMPLALPDGGELVLEPLLRHRGRLGLKDFDPCTILLNNDLAAGIPPVLAGLHEQYLLPPLHAGWAVRRKSQHFRAYEEVAKKFAKLLGMDPWLINPLFVRCGKVNLGDASTGDAVTSHAEALLGKVRRKYKEYGIHDKPFIVVRADAGRRGMGITTVREPSDLAALSQRVRNAMRVASQGQEASELMLQEGVPSCERIGKAVAEPVVYMIDRYVVGGFYRVNGERGEAAGLNAPRASFVPLAFAEANPLPRSGAKPGASAPNRFYMYGVIARLAMVAASYELEATDPNAEVYA